MAWVYEAIARMYAYNPFGLAFSVRWLYSGVETVCGQLSPLALAFYHALGHCV